MPSWSTMGFQDSSSPFMNELLTFHDYVLVTMMMVVVLISYITIFLLKSSLFYKFLSEGTFIETIWSIVPALILVALVLPSMKVLYMMEDIKTPSFTFKIVGHQWYWTYISPMLNNNFFIFKGEKLEFTEKDSMMEQFSFYSKAPRLMETSDSLMIPVNTSSRMIITSTDVIHAFAVPSLGLKVDALPGRLNQLYVNPSRVGVFLGQCSEICGSNHSFMPISVMVPTLEGFEKWNKLTLLNIIKNLKQ